MAPVRHDPDASGTSPDKERSGPPRWIWPFELQDKIGEGGMGVVYRARYVKNDRLVAIKLVPEDVAGDATLVARFEREMEVLKGLRHPNIVHCFGGSCEGNQRFYAMELVEGGTLAQRLAQEGRLNWEQAVEYARQMCAALGFAHEKGVIHRDVKPGNFLVSKNGQLKLSDFGLATMSSANRLTKTGRTLGTFHYMAPEQIRGRPPLSSRTDLYALGCVIFEMLAGHPPFEGDTPAEVLHKHLREMPPRVGSIALDCPTPLDHLVATLLEKDPEQRPASAAEIDEQLHRITEQPQAAVTRFFVAPTAADILGSSGPQAKTRMLQQASDFELPRPRERGISLAVAGVAGSLLLVAIIGLWINASQHAARAARAETLLLESLGQSDREVQIAAAQSLGALSPLRESTVSAMLEQLPATKAETRVAIVDVLGNQVHDTDSLAGSLLKVQKEDDSPDVRYAAEQAIKTLRSRPTGSSNVLSGLWYVLLAVVAGAIGWLGYRAWLAFDTVAHREPDSRA